MCGLCWARQTLEGFCLNWAPTKLLPSPWQPSGAKKKKKKNVSRKRKKNKKQCRGTALGAMEISSTETGRIWHLVQTVVRVWWRRQAPIKIKGTWSWLLWKRFSSNHNGVLFSPWPWDTSKNWFDYTVYDFIKGANGKGQALTAVSLNYLELCGRGTISPNHTHASHQTVQKGLLKSGLD